MENKGNALALIGIVAIVAIVAIVVLFMNAKKTSETDQGSYLVVDEAGNVVGNSVGVRTFTRTALTLYDVSGSVSSGGCKDIGESCSKSSECCSNGCLRKTCT